VPAAAADVVAVLLFAAAGRSSHAEGVTADGVLTTAWPFLAGAALGWLVVRLWRGAWPGPAGAGSRHTTLDGAVVAVLAVAGGMVLRRATGAGTDPAFVVVALLVLEALLVGWRLLWSLLRRRSRPTWGRRRSARLGG
jgi:hypothetical protein